MVRAPEAREARGPVVVKVWRPGGRCRWWSKLPPRALAGRAGLPLVLDVSRPPSASVEGPEGDATPLPPQ